MENILSCSESNPELWADFLRVFKNINGREFKGRMSVTAEECQEYLDDIRDTCR
jgi:hypothetical protein